MPRKQPVEQRGAGPADVQIAGRRGGKTNADVRSHSIVILSESEGSRKSSMRVVRSLAPPGMTGLLSTAYIDFHRMRCSGGCVSRPYTSLDENLPGTAARVAISREIHFRDWRIALSERADALDHVKANFGNVLRAQPFQNRPALKCNGERAKFQYGKIR